MYAAGPLADETSSLAVPTVCEVNLKPVLSACKRTRRWVPFCGGTSRSSITNMNVASALVVAAISLERASWGWVAVSESSLEWVIVWLGCLDTYELSSIVGLVS